MALVIALALLLGGTIALVKGADWFTDGAGDLAKALGVSALLIVLLACVFAGRISRLVGGILLMGYAAYVISVAVMR